MGGLIRQYKAVYYGAVLWPYLIVGLGLYGWHNAWLAMGGYHLGMGLVLGLTRPPLRQPNLPWRRPVPLLLGATFLGSALAGVLILVLWPWLVKSPHLALETLLADWGLTVSGWPIFAGYFCLVNPWLEELYWRNWLGQSSRPVWEISAWFAGYHALVLLPVLQWGWLVAALLLLTITGWWWSRLLKLGSGVVGPVLCHLAADVSIMLALTQLIAR